MEDIDDAQRVLERKALANVRALVDKSEAEDRYRSINAIRFGVKVIPAVFVAVVVAVGGASYITRTKHQPVRVPQTTTEFVEQVLRKIESKSNEAPLQRELHGLNGRVAVSFDVKPNGYIDNLKVNSSSGDSRTDGQATRLTKSLEPYLPLPVNSGNGIIHVNALFRLTTNSDGRGSVAVEPGPRQP